MIRILALLALPTLAACQPDETISGYVGGQTLWQLSELDGKPFREKATLRFEAEGRITGQAPCNRYFASQTAPYPWIAIGPVGSTKRACPALKDEYAYLSALPKMTLAEVSGPVLILSTDEGPFMVFEAVSRP